MVQYFQGYYIASNALILKQNVTHYNKRCNTPSKNFLIFFFSRVLHQYIASAMPSLSLRYDFALGSLPSMEQERTYNGLGTDL